MQGAGGIGGLVFVRQYGTEAGSYYPAYDANGNLTAMIRADDKSVVASYDYSPYGELLASSGSYASTNPFRFSTKYTDTETNLAYFGYRYYNPDTGRWLNRDPIEEKGGGNLYGYVRNEPMIHIDPLGHKPETCCWLCSRTHTFTGESGGYTSPWAASAVEIQWPGKNATKGCKCKLCGKLGTKNYGFMTEETKLAEAHKGKCCACSVNIRNDSSPETTWFTHYRLEIICPKWEFSADKMPMPTGTPLWQTAWISFEKKVRTQGSIYSSITISCDAAEKLRDALHSTYPESADYSSPWSEERYHIGVYDCFDFAQLWMNKGREIMCPN